MSLKSHMLAAGVTVGLAVALLAGALAASAATPACGSSCLSVFSRELGTRAQPNFVEGIFGGTAQLGRPVGLEPASSSDSSEDIIGRPGPHVSDFFVAGMVSADVNHYYAGLTAVQQEYAPNGVPTGLCVGLASVAYQDEGLTLQPCGVNATTVWIVDPDLAKTTPGFFPIINGSTTDFSRPFAMALPRDELASGRPLQMQTRHLQFLGPDGLLPDRQLWGVHPGPLD